MKWRFALIALAAVTTSIVAAKWARPVSAPLDRLLKNAEAKLKAEPKSAYAFYLVGRLRSLAYAYDSNQVEVYDPDKSPRFPPYAGVQVPFSRRDRKLNAKTQAHLISSIGHYKKATELEPSNGLYWLGYAWMLEQGALWAAQLPKKAATGWPADVGTLGWHAAAGQAYRKAFLKAKDADAKRTSRFISANATVSLEAIDALIRLNDAKQIKLDSALLSEMKAHEKKIASQPIMKTPIVFPLEAGTPFGAIDNPKAKVKFDLDGGGIARRWSWITPRAAFLVWHPLNDGKVDSGRELFGNATFWMFFRNGYEALASLDDNLDGELRGWELRFIAAWRDINSNGISEPGEVRPLRAYGIEAIRCRPDGKVGNVWFKKQGMVRTNGSTLPTYDWVAKRR
jgi:hypothetical protein